MKYFFVVCVDINNSICHCILLCESDGLLLSHTWLAGPRQAAVWSFLSALKRGQVGGCARPGNRRIKQKRSASKREARLQRWALISFRLLFFPLRRHNLLASMQVQNPSSLRNVPQKRPATPPTPRHRPSPPMISCHINFIC